MRWNGFETRGMEIISALGGFWGNYYTFGLQLHQEHMSAAKRRTHIDLKQGIFCADKNGTQLIILFLAHACARGNKI